MQRAEVAVLPNGAAGRTFLYATAYDDGRVKVGCTNDPKTRIGCLFDECRRKGRRMTGAYVVETKRHKHEAERRLIDLVRKVASPVEGRREWFEGVEPSALVPLVHLATT